ncbi:MAG: TIGR00266 family protein [Spirochaetota bacterium]
MRTEISGSPSFAHVHVDLSPSESVIAENDAMQSMSADIQMTTKTNGGFLSALGKKLFGGESFFVNRFSNAASGPRRVTVAQDVPGEILELQLRDGQEICLQKGAFLACTEKVQLKTSWAGFVSWISGEGLVKLKAGGAGTLWYGAYGGIIKREVRGELKVDDGHLVAYDPALKLKLAMAGGFFASLFGGEGLVTRLVGNGTVYIQTRSIRGLAAWLNPKFR